LIKGRKGGAGSLNGTSGAERGLKIGYILYGWRMDMNVGEMRRIFL
jgi:hypothetical protein